MTSEKTSRLPSADARRDPEDLADVSTIGFVPEARTIPIDRPEGDAAAAEPRAVSSGVVSGSAAAGSGVAGASVGSAGVGSPTAGSTAAGSAATTRPLASTSLSNSLSGGVDTSGLSDEEAVKARRVAHGLSPEAEDKAAEEARKRAEREASAGARIKKARREHRVKVAKRAAIVAFVLLVLVVVVGFWLLRWGLYDDKQSIQGTWRVQGTSTTIQISDDHIRLTDEVSYSYAIDPVSKTLTFSFGNLTGSGRYRFSLDHDQLSLNDGNFDWMSTLGSDIPWMADALTRKLAGDLPKSPAIGSGDIVLERVE